MVDGVRKPTEKIVFAIFVNGEPFGCVSPQPVEFPNLMRDP